MRLPSSMFAAVCASLLGALQMSHAQSPPTQLALRGGDAAPPVRPDPLDPQAAVPAVTYKSPLAGYRRHAQEPVVSWQKSNETVNRIGGWRTYTRDAARELSAPPPSATPSSPPVPSPPAHSPAQAPAKLGPAASPPPPAAPPHRHSGHTHK
jgi:hypothetical protein